MALVILAAIHHDASLSNQLEIHNAPTTYRLLCWQRLNSYTFVKFFKNSLLEDLRKRNVSWLW